MDAHAGVEPRLLSPGARLVHIGPHKTGTTAVQQAFHRSRAELAAHGVRYAGTRLQAYREAIGLTGKRGQLGSPPGKNEDWESLVAESRAAGQDRYVVSSESFANAEPEHIRRLAADLGPQVLVLRMVRRYDKLVTSQWQQLVAAGSQRTFEQYLDTLVKNDDALFWRRHGFVPLTKRWADGVGADHLEIVVVNEHDRGWLLRVFERHLGLDDGFLVPTSGDANRSLTAAEVEVLRNLNDLRVMQAWRDRTHLEYVRRAAAPAFRQLAPDPLDGRNEVPGPVLDLLAARTNRDRAALRDLGITTVGDLSWLDVERGDERSESSDGGDCHTTAGTLRVDSVVRAAAAVVDRHIERGSFDLGGARSSMVGALRAEEHRRLMPGEDAVVSRLEGWGWPDPIVDRFVHRGLRRWLVESAALQGRPAEAQNDPDRVAPISAAVALSGVIAQTDPEAADAQLT